MQILEHYIGVSIWIVFFLIVITLVFSIVSMRFKKNNKWICKTCDIELTRKQIKFGLCPYCGKRVENFRGLHR